MPYIAPSPKSYLNKSVGDGQCVAYVREASSAPATGLWRKGNSVRASDYLISGTVIATFDSTGLYGSRKDGTCHAAIFIAKSAVGIVVYDQWITNGKRQPVHERTIRFDNVHGKKINDGDEYYVVE